jgi:hypothetical protein
VLIVGCIHHVSCCLKWKRRKSLGNLLHHEEIGQIKAILLIIRKDRTEIAVEKFPIMACSSRFMNKLLYHCLSDEEHSQNAP